MLLTCSIGTQRCKQDKKWILDGRIVIHKDTSRHLTGVDAFEIGEFEYALAQDRWEITLLVGRKGTLDGHPLLARNPIRGRLSRQQAYPSQNRRLTEPKFKNACIAIQSSHFPYLKQEQLPLHKAAVTPVAPGVIKFSIPEECRRETAYEGGPVICDPPVARAA